MKVQVYSQPLWIVEWMNYAYCACNNIKAEKILNKDDLNGYAPRAEQFHRQLLESIPVSDKLKKYFTQYEENQGCLAMMLVYTFVTFPELEDNNIENTLILRCKRFDRQYCYPFSFTFTGLKFDRQAVRSSFVQLVKNCNLTTEQKFDLICAFDDPETSIKEIFELLQEIHQVAQRYAKEIVVMCRRASKEIEEAHAQGLLEEYMKKCGSSAKEIKVYPSFSHYASLQAVGLENPLNPLVFLVGLALKQEFWQAVHLERDKDKNLADLLRVLSDTSKYEILRQLSFKSMYGGEIAKKLNLRTSTISYHMDALSQAGLIESEKVNNRVYYSLQKERLENLLSYLKQSLLN